MSSTHKAAVITDKGSPLEVQTLTTPKPGPKELLISVKAIAVNPIDYYMRELGIFLKGFPAVPGSDIAGTVEAVGSEIPSSSPFKPGTRVAAFATAFFHQGEPPYGAFQEKVVVPVENTAVIPDKVSFVEASTLPMGIFTAWSGWTSIGLGVDTKFSPADKQGLLVWGASSSVGSCAVQVGNRLGYTVYATSSPKHHASLKSLGATETFDYNSPTVVRDIISSAKSADIALKTAYKGMGATQPIIDVLLAFGGGKLASAVNIQPTDPTHPDVEIKFIVGPNETDEAREKHFAFVFQGWLAPKLESGEFVPAPPARVVPGGVGGLNDALEAWKAGVSGEKIVVEV